MLQSSETVISASKLNEPSHDEHEADARLTRARPLDQLDRRIAVALQMNPRASWRQIAAVVESSESTVKRRAEQLMQRGVIRITTIDVGVSDGFPVLVQFTCDLKHAPTVGQTLAARDDVRFVALVTGPFDVVAEMIVPSNRRLAEILLGDFATLPQTTGTTTETVLHTFKTSYDWGLDVLGDKAALLELMPAMFTNNSRSAGSASLDETSRMLLQQLKEDGRRSFADLASRSGVSESMARYRVEQMFTKAGIRPATLIDPYLLGFDCELLLWLRVDLAQRESVAKALTARREVRYVSATSGHSDLVCEIFLRSQREVYDFSTDVLGKLPGVQQVNMASELLTLKRAYARFDSGVRFPSDESYGSEEER